MKIAFQTSSGCLYHGDALDVIRTLAPDSVDALVTDPPYSSGGFTRADKARPTSDKYQNSETPNYYPEFAGDCRDQRAYTLWCSEWLRLALHAVRPGGVACVFTDWRQLAATVDALQVAGWVLRGVAAWDKTEACRPTLGRFRQQCEFLVWGSKGPMPVAGEALPGCWRKMNVAREKRHIAAKPVEVMEQIVRICPQGGTVLDPFMGSGTTAVACERTGRQWVGCEITPEYIQICQERLQEPVGLSLLEVG